ncbi:4Fe-4S dicluster domain-containing protein [Deltaproteobacteria bacterium TL4]
MQNHEKFIPSAKITRRKLFKRSTLVCIGSAVAYGALSVPVLRSEELRLRPPGALEESKFVASCIKCGQCLQVCPPQVIHLAGLDLGLGIGTPYIIPREGACILCGGLPCVLACPTGSLDHQISEGKEAQMGLAVMSNAQTCLSVKGKNDLLYRFEQLEASKWNASSTKELLSALLQELVERINTEEKKQLQTTLNLRESDSLSLEGLIEILPNLDLSQIIDFIKKTQLSAKTCTVCLDQCPIKNEKPIIFETQKDIQTSQNYVLPVVQKSCVGCGVCEMKCPTPQSSITITPRLKYNGI